jgi:alpha-aminoadipic semialdehyde synthase
MPSRPLVGIRHEDKNRFERRAPLAPEHVRALVGEHGLEVWVETSPSRVFDDEAYRGAGARIVDDLSPCPVVLGVKEIPAAKLTAGTAYMYFAHVVKGQAHNMGMLATLLERGCHLIDHEKVADARGRRLIFFGHWAGVAGMIDTLWALGERLALEGIDSPLGKVRRAFQYASVADATGHLGTVGARLAAEGVPAALRPLVVGIAGYGNVSRGAQQMLDLLPVTELTPAALLATPVESLRRERRIVKVVFAEEHMAAPLAPGQPFVLCDYYDHPDRYQPSFAPYLDRLTVLVNCIYWDERYPRLLTRADVARLWAAGPPALRVIGDISCDLAGAIEVTARTTTVDRPVFVHEPASGEARDGLEGAGPVVMAIDNLPCELPADATRSFGDTLVRFVPALARTDFRQRRDALGLPAELARALIVHQGELTADYAYLKEYLATGR